MGKELFHAYHLYIYIYIYRYSRTHCFIHVYLSYDVMIYRTFDISIRIFGALKTHLFLDDTSHMIKMWLKCGHPKSAVIGNWMKTAGTFCD